MYVKVESRSSVAGWSIIGARSRNGQSCRGDVVNFQRHYLPGFRGVTTWSVEQVMAVLQRMSPICSFGDVSWCFGVVVSTMTT